MTTGLGRSAEMPVVLRDALKKHIEDASFAYGRSAARDAARVADVVEDLLVRHPDAEAHRNLLRWWLRQFDEQTVEPCFCIGDARTGERTPNPHCPRHRPPKARAGEHRPSKRHVVDGYAEVYCAFDGEDWPCPAALPSGDVEAT